MVFQFEHVEIGGGDYGKWTTERYDFKEFKKIMIKWQEELAGKAWNSLSLATMTSQEVYPDLEMTILLTAIFQPRCWRPAFI